MAKTEKEDRQEEKYNRSSSIPNTTNAPKKEDAIEHKNATDIKKQQEQEQIKPPPIPEETIVIKEDKYARKNFWVQSTLAGVGIFTLLAFILFGILQHQDSINNLKWARESADSSAKDIRQSLALTERNVAIADSSLKATRQSIFHAERVSKYDLRPYIVTDPTAFDISLIVNQPITAKITIRNIGKTPAYNYFHVNLCYTFLTTYADYSEEKFIKKCFEQSGWHKEEGHSIGSNLPEVKDGIYGNLTLEDSIGVFNGNMKLIFSGLVSYSDIFKERHFTWYCFEFDIKKSVFIIIAKHTGAN
jgi:hypothetical protein